MPNKSYDIYSHSVKRIDKQKNGDFFIYPVSEISKPFIQVMYVSIYVPCFPIWSVITGR